MTNIQDFEQIASFGKDNLDAFVKSGTVAVKGFEEFAKAYAALAKQSVERTTAAYKALLAVKSPTELQSVYADLAKSGIETAIADSRKLGELANSVVTASVAPLNARVQAVTSLFKAA